MSEIRQQNINGGYWTSAICMKMLSIPKEKLPIVIMGGPFCRSCLGVVYNRIDCCCGDRYCFIYIQNTCNVCCPEV